MMGCIKIYYYKNNNCKEVLIYENETLVEHLTNIDVCELVKLLKNGRLLVNVLGISKQMNECNYRGTLCLINKKTGHCDLLGTIKDVMNYLVCDKQYIFDVINGFKEDRTYNIVVKIDGVT